MTFQVQSSIPYHTGLPKDVCTNTWHFNFTGTGTPDSSDFALLKDQVAAFYEYLYVVGGTYELAAYAYPTNHRVKIYDLDDSPPRVPVVDQIDALNVKGATVTTLSPETAVCLSYRGALVSGTAPARRRGRIFLGCLSGAAITAGSSSAFPVVSSGFITRAKDAALAVIAATPTTGWTWVVYHRGGAVPGGGDFPSSTPVVAGWIDNAFDTQRRRGGTASQRVTW